MDTEPTPNRGTLSRFITYLSTRQTEVWGFFAAGYVLAHII